MGNKNSGRRPYSQESLRRETIQRAWQVTHAQLNSANQSKDTLSTAKDIVLKTIPSEVKQSIDMDARIISKEEEEVINNYIERNRMQNN